MRRALLMSALVASGALSLIAQNVGIGTTTPDAKLHIAGTLKIADGTEGAGKVLSSDGVGLAAWQVLSVLETDPKVGTLSSNSIPRWNGTTLEDGLIMDQDTLVKISTDAIINGITIGRGAGNIFNNTVIGLDALSNNTTGFANTVTGYQALQNNTTGLHNTASGALALFNNTTGNFNTASGYRTLISNTTGFNNTASGTEALMSNTVGANNTASGNAALFNNTMGNDNTASGSNTLFRNTTGIKNTAIGKFALFNTTTGNFNTASGYQALDGNVSGSDNVALGADANVLTGALNNATAIGAGAVVDASNKIQLGNAAVDAVQLGAGSNVTLETGLIKLTGGSPGAGKVLTSDASGLASWESPAAPVETDPKVGTLTSNSVPRWNGTTLEDGLITDQDTLVSISTDATINDITIGRGAGNVNTNTAAGFQALHNNTTGKRNTANGYNALLGNTTGQKNTAIGNQALVSNTTGSGNTAGGYEALRNNSTGTGNSANGSRSLLFNTTGENNTASGGSALFTNNTGSNNTATGSQALFSNVSGSHNIALGSQADVSVGNLTNATAIGANAVVDASNKIQLGNDSVNAVQLGTGSNVTLETGHIKLTGGSPGAGKVLTSDASGLASWSSDISNAETDPKVGTLTSNSIPRWNGTTLVDGLIMDQDTLVSISSDATIHGITFGRGAGDDSTNTASGYQALQNNTTGLANTASGSQALLSNTTGSNNTASGYQALRNNTTGVGNTASGNQALLSNTTGGNNMASGSQALQNNTTANNNTASGNLALFSNTTGSNNTASGFSALRDNTIGNDNTGSGVGALAHNTIGDNNAATGFRALHWNTTGTGNTANGFRALFNNTIGNNNTASGDSALLNNITGSNNVAIGTNADVSTGAQNNATAIGAGAVVDASNKIQLGNSAVDAVQLGTGSNVTLETGLIKLTGGSPGDGKVLTSDASGLASWEAPTTPAETDPKVGTLSSNSIPRWNGTTLEDGLITDNGTVVSMSVDAKINGITVGRGAGNDTSNTASGFQAFFSNTEGNNNTAIGYEALFSNTEGNNNTGSGFRVLHRNTTGTKNTAAGKEALHENTTGESNVATGFRALFSNTSGGQNTASGFGALRYNTTGSSNTASGNQSLFSNEDGNNNTASGNRSLYNNLDGDHNAASGNRALHFNTTGHRNTASGYQALDGNVSGSDNVALGADADVSTDTLNNATAIGAGAVVDASNKIQLGNDSVNAVQLGTSSNVTLETGHLKLTGGSPGAGKVLTSDTSGLAGWSSDISGVEADPKVGTLTSNSIPRWNGTTLEDGLISDQDTLVSIGADATINGVTVGRGLGNNNSNSAIGRNALVSNTTGGSNTAIGRETLFNNTEGGNNTAIGRNTLRSNTAGMNNTAVGRAALNCNTTGNNNTALGNNADVSFDSLTNATAIGASAVVDANNKVRIGNSSVSSNGGQVSWTAYSDARIKDNINENVPGLSFITELRPVTYHYNVTRQNNLLGISNDENWVGKYAIENIQFSGFLAQEVEAAANRIGYNFSGVDKNGTVLGLRYAEFVVPLVKAVQEQQEEIEILEEEVARYKNYDAILAQMQEAIEQLQTENSVLKEQMVQLGKDLQD